MYPIYRRRAAFASKGMLVSSFLYRIGRASYRHRGRVLIAWVAILILFGGLAATVGGKFNDVFEIPGAESTIALKQLKVTFPEAADATATVVVTVPEGNKLTDEDVTNKIKSWLDHIEALSYVNGTIGPYSEHVKGLISDDGRTGRVTVRVQGTVSTFGDAHREELTKVAESLTETLPQAKVLVGGEVFSVNVPHLSVVEAAGLGVAIVVLLITLGSFVASMMPVGSALAGVGLAVMIIQIAAGVIDMSSTTLMLAIMLGLAVGIDYALFIISRHRDQLATGMETEESAARAVGTAGSAVIFAGLTVIIALVGLSIANVPFLTTMGVFGAVGVGLEVLLALTLLPALMGFAGQRLRPRTSRRAAARATKDTAGHAPGTGLSARWVRVATKWPVVTVVVVLAALGALSYPTKDLFLALPTSGRSLPGAQDRVAADEISKVFGVGYNGPLIVTVDIVESDDPMKIMDGLRDEIEAMPGVALVAASTPNANADTGMVQVIPTTAPDDPATADLVHALRDREPQWKQQWGVNTAITGFTAISIDVTERLRDALLPFALFVVGLSLILLTMVFRSIWVPVKAALGYLLSVGGAFGTTTLVFNQGWFRQVINLPEAGPVISFLPIIGMGILFGLAMDYEVFLVSRMREEHVHGNVENSVVDGFVHSAKVVAAAALIMFSVFAFFVPNGEGPIKSIAFALAIGVLLDAFVVRMTLVPAVMTLLGRHAWWLPRWLDRILPTLDIEGEGLTRQLALADWPRPGDDSAIAAEGLSASADGRALFREVDVRLPRGGLLVVEGEPAARRALLLGLAGRLTLDEGRVKTLGLVLPEEGPLLRDRVPVVTPHTPHLATVLKRHQGALIVVDDADDLSTAQERELRDSMNTPHTPEPTTWVLGVLPGSPLLADLTGPYQLLRLPSHLSLEGASR